MMRKICIHAHFYQPARENPWLEEIEIEDTAYPCHNWNERISAECYTPNTAARILGPEGKIQDIVNNYAWINFNFGPTLLSWLEKYRPSTYQAILEADRESRRRFSGHGGAIAQPYNHTILPLSSREDLQTQVIWGIRDFEKRFGRVPEGMWLPEMAVNYPTLEVLAEQGIVFTILGPDQAARVRSDDNSPWREVSPETFDCTRPYQCRLPSGRSITLFFRDAQVSWEVGFGELLRDGKSFAERLISRFTPGSHEDQLVHIATDGETFGHHKKFGDMALAYCLRTLEADNPGMLTVYGEYLEHHPPREQVEIRENTAWSCPHGLDRWRGACECGTGKHPEWSPEWRTSLRLAMDTLHESLASLYEEEMVKYASDPWEVRNAAISIVLDRSDENVESFLASWMSRSLTPDEKVRVLKLLEIQRNAMLMYTSCGWFFDDIAGVEPVQVLRYAGRAMQLAAEFDKTDLEEKFLAILRDARGNTKEFPDGAAVYNRLVRPAIFDTIRVGAHYILLSLYHEEARQDSAGNQAVCERSDTGREKITVGRMRLLSDITHEERLFSFTALQTGVDGLRLGVVLFPGEEEFTRVQSSMMKAFRSGDMSRVESHIRREFSPHVYSFSDFSLDERHRATGLVISGRMSALESSLLCTCREFCPVIPLLKETRNPIPWGLSALGTYAENASLQKALETTPIDKGMIRQALSVLIAEGYRVDPSLREAAGAAMVRLLRQVAGAPDDIEHLRETGDLLELMQRAGFHPNLWEAQNLYLQVFSSEFSGFDQRVSLEEKIAARREAFDRIGDLIGAKPGG
jgi:alpha-amylase/alpha-mannosidase (GH57 family)